MDKGNLVKFIRSNTELTQEKSAKVIAVTKRTWERWEAGKMNPTPAFLELFCIKTGLDFVKIIKIFEVINDLTSKITLDILSKDENREVSSDFCKLAYYEGKISITNLENINTNLNFKYEANIKIKYDSFLKEKEIQKQVLKFLTECNKKELDLIYE